MLSCNSGHMWVTKKTNISQSRIGVECYIPKNVWGSKGNNQRGCIHEIIQWKKLLYIDTDAFGVGLGAALMQTRDNMSCHRDEAPDNSILRPIVFGSRSPTGAEKRYSNIKNEALGILYSLEKCDHYYLPGR